MSQTDRYTSPLSERYASKEMQYVSLSGYEVQNMEKTMDSSGRDRERTGTADYPGTD